MAYNLSRMTIYAMVSAIEEDLREIIRSHLGSKSTSDKSFDQALLDRAKLRLEKDNSYGYDSDTLASLVDYFDLGDTYQLINSHPDKFPKTISDEIKLRTKSLQALVPVRNRVMHIRPLNFNDLPLVTDFCEELIYSSPSTWINVTNTVSHLKADPSFVLGLSIPSTDVDSRISHNLPLPDFDETGLIGRDDLVEQVKKLCLGGFPVISIVGEGGIGKSALALKVAYELLDDPKSKFDAIIWVTSKTTQITVNEIREIRGAITDSIGVISEISSQLGTSTTTQPLEEIAEYLSTFKIALFIDNLETIMDDTIRTFVGALPEGSKIIITSRIGLGAYEYPIKLSGMAEKYASELLRNLSKLRNVPLLLRQDEATVRRFVNRMHLNPGYIKWFVSAVQSGQAPEAVLQNSHLFLEFCMSNVYKFLSQDAREITATMQCEPGGKDLPELHFLSGMEAIRIQKALQELLTTNMLSESSKPSGGSIRTTYQLAELARAYLNKHHKPSQVTLKKFRDNRNKLNSMVENNNHGFKNDKYATHNVKVRSKSDQIIFKRLREVLQHIKEGSYDIAYEILEECQKLSPEYYEVARIFAFFHQKRGNYTEARENYELAIALAPDTPQLLFWFGKFIMTCEQDLDSAIQNFEAAHKLDSGSPEISVNLARAHMIQHSFDRAHQLLEQCNATASSLSDHLRGMYYDTTVQIHYRQADDFCSSGRTTEAITSLNDMILAFNRLPSDISDQYIRGKLSKANLTVQRLLRSCTDATSSKNLHEISEWLERESRAKSKATRSRT